MEVIFLPVLVAVIGLNLIPVDALNQIKGRDTCLTHNVSIHGPKIGTLTTVLWISALLSTSSTVFLPSFLQPLTETEDSALEKR